MSSILGYICVVLCVLVAFGCRRRDHASTPTRGTIVSRTNVQRDTVNTSILLEDGTFVWLTHRHGGPLLSISISGRDREGGAMFTNANGALRPLSEAESLELKKAQQYWKDYFDGLSKGPE